MCIRDRIDLEAVEGMKYSFLFVAKGGGSANKTYLYQETKAQMCIRDSDRVHGKGVFGGHHLRTGIQQGMADPVSYTHLDVYKRQYEYSLAHTGKHPLVDPSRPVEPLRTIHSYDPCQSCAVHRCV